MKKDVILKRITDSIEKNKNNKARSIMDTSESFYDPYYLVGTCFTPLELLKMSEVRLNDLIRLADHASGVFV